MDRFGHKVRLSLVGVLLLVSAIVAPIATPPQVAKATEISTACKWDFPWPREVRYFIWVGSNPSYDFTDDEATRVQYGAETWSPSFNLYFGRVGSPGESENGYSVVERYPLTINGQPDGAVARTYVRTDCNVDFGDPIREVTTRFNSHYTWVDDCLAAQGWYGYDWCEANRYLDLHNTATHEFGHWFFIRDACNEQNPCDGDPYRTEATMYFRLSRWGEVKRRTLEAMDHDAAREMYGCRVGGC